jgi:hypothetical protein
MSKTKKVPDINVESRRKLGYVRNTYAFTMRELATILNTTRANICNWLHGKGIHSKFRARINALYYGVLNTSLSRQELLEVAWKGYELVHPKIDPTSVHRIPVESIPLTTKKVRIVLEGRDGHEETHIYDLTKTNIEMMMGHSLRVREITSYDEKPGTDETMIGTD